LGGKYPPFNYFSRKVAKTPRRKNLLL